MVFSNKNRVPASRFQIGILMTLVLTALFLAVGLPRINFASSDTVIYEAACRELIAGTTEGRQALVSSVWWPPVPVLLRLPLVSVLGTDGGPVSSILISALFGALCIVLLGRMLRIWKMGWQRWLVMAAFAANPDFLRASMDGSSVTTILFLVLASFFGLVEWVAARTLRHLVYLAVSVAFLFATSFEMCPWAILVLLLVVADQLMEKRDGQKKEAVLILALFPAVYALGLWMLMSWLIMGDWLYFIRSLSPVPGGRVIMRTHEVIVGPMHLISAGLGLGLLWLAATRKNRSVAFAGALAFAPLAIAGSMDAIHLLSDSSPAMVSLYPLALIAVAYGTIVLLGETWLRSLALPVVAAMMVVVALASWGGSSKVFRTERRSDESSVVLPQIEKYVLQKSKFATVFVTGYDAFRLVGSHRSKRFIPSFDLNFDKIRQDYVGHDIYVLVHKPLGRSAMDSAQWKFNRLYAVGGPCTIYDSDWGPWRLFEVIQAPRAGR